MDAFVNTTAGEAPTGISLECETPCPFIPHLSTQKDFGGKKNSACVEFVDIFFLQ